MTSGAATELGISGIIIALIVTIGWAPNCRCNLETRPGAVDASNGDVLLHGRPLREWAKGETQALGGGE